MILTRALRPLFQCLGTLQEARCLVGEVSDYRSRKNTNSSFTFMSTALVTHFLPMQLSFNIILQRPVRIGILIAFQCDSHGYFYFAQIFLFTFYLSI